MSNPNHTGAVVEAAVTLEAVRAGIEVFKPLSEHSRADLVLGIDSTLYRVQCKSARRTGETLCINLVGSRHTPSGYVRTKYSPHEVDLVAAHCPDLGTSYLIPFELVAPAKSGIHLRLSPAKNGQIAAIHFAADYEFAGAVAQLARALPWHGRGQGFESPQLHLLNPARENHGAGETIVGADEFRIRFGYWMQCASRGAEILITRRGRPFARLSPHLNALR